MTRRSTHREHPLASQGKNNEGATASDVSVANVYTAQRPISYKAKQVLRTFLDSVVQEVAPHTARYWRSDFPKKPSLWFVTTLAAKDAARAHPERFRGSSIEAEAAMRAELPYTRQDLSVPIASFVVGREVGPQDDLRDGYGITMNLLTDEVLEQENRVFAQPYAGQTSAYPSISIAEFVRPLNRITPAQIAGIENVATRLGEYFTGGGDTLFVPLSQPQITHFVYAPATDTLQTVNTLRG